MIRRAIVTGTGAGVLAGLAIAAVFIALTSTQPESVPGEFIGWTTFYLLTGTLFGGSCGFVGGIAFGFTLRAHRGVALAAFAAWAVAFAAWMLGTELVFRPSGSPLPLLLGALGATVGTTVLTLVFRRAPAPDTPPGTPESSFDA